jgi:hypothetical protein
MATQIKLRRDTGANWTTNSTVVLAEGEIGVNLTTGQFKLGNGASTWAALTYFEPGAGGTGDRLTNGLNEVTLNATGALVYPNGALQRDTGVVNCAGNASTMIYTTSSASNQHTIKLLIQVEGTVGAAVDMDTQACEMIIAKSFRADAIAASVYGVVHTSVAPLATFTADWNVLTSKVEVLCTTPSANGVSVKIFATEITTSD